MGQKIVQVDAFTDRPFAGNPAGVCILDRPRSDAWMQHVAREMNLSETAFLLPLDGPPDAGGPEMSTPAPAGAAATIPGTAPAPATDYHLRWFTPATEVDLCGHATLASAHVLWEEGRLPPTWTVRFHTRSGLLTATSDGAWITLDFPARPPQAVPEAPPGLVEALGLPSVGASALYVGFARSDYIIEIGAGDPEGAVRSLRPDFGALSRAKARGVIVTARVTARVVGAAGGVAGAVGPRVAGAEKRAGEPLGGYDFVSRFFAPNVGINEDPVTGSAHCCLAPYWGKRLGKAEMVGRQVSARGGMVKVRLEGDRVKISGQAVTMLRGELLEV